MIKTATIRILDEVNVIVAGLTQDDYEIMSERFAVYANNYFYDIRFKLEKWDGKIRFFSGNGVTYINLLEEILPHLKKSGYQIKYIDKRMDCKYTIPRIDDQYLADWGVTLGEHQLRAINLATETNNGMIIAGTGAGKTMITAVLCDLYVTYAHAKMIVIVPNIDLVGQTATELRDYDLEVGVYSGSEKSLKENIIVSTWQSLQNNKVIMGQFDGVIVDECHGVTGKQLQDILNQYGKHMQIRIGMTGTLPKSPVDLMTIKVCLGEVLITVPASELIANGWLAGLHINMYRLDEDFREEWEEFQELKRKEGRPEWDHIVDLKSYEAYRFPDYDAEKNFLLKNSIRRTFLADYIENLRGNRKGNTFVLVSSVQAGKKLAKLIDGAFFVYGQDKTVVRKKIYKLFDDNDNIVVISTFQLASTGLNIKRIFNLVFVDAGKSFTKIIQAIGRGLRKAADKDFVNVYDFFSGLKYAKKHAGQRKSFYKEQQYDHTLKKITYAQYYKDVD